jgi:hypothetical protein
MADKPAPMTIEDLARAEAQMLKQREQAHADFLEGEKQLATAVPERFFQLVRQLRDGVRRFNTAAAVERLVQYWESPAVTTRDPSFGNADYTVEVKRKPNQVTLSLRNMARGARPDAFLIEGKGEVGLTPMVDRFLLRVDASWKDGAPLWRITSDFKKVDCPVDELAERIIIVIVTGEHTRLWGSAPWMGLHDPTRDPTVKR